MQAQLIRHELRYHSRIRTSRGTMQSHTAYYIQVNDGMATGIGEAAPLPGLSPDDPKLLMTVLQDCVQQINQGQWPDFRVLQHFPSVRFALDTARRILESGGSFTLNDNAFVHGQPMPINGLVWMDDIEPMLEAALSKAEQGFSCIKFKVGAQDFDAECRMLEQFRKRWSAFTIDIRLDANGAFANDEALEKLNELSRFEVHSIEQPIRPGQIEAMHELCRLSRIPIALDEELIGIDPLEKGQQLLKQILPAFIIIKPTLIGEFAACDTWVHLAQSLDINWWATSALESNIGLNAIAQWCAGYQPLLAQGLGTGQLYENNVASPLTINNGALHYDHSASWQFPPSHPET